MQTEGERINIIIKELKLSRQDLARHFDCTDKYISNVINDVKKLSRDRLHYLLVEFNVNINYVLEGVGSMLIKENAINEDDVVNGFNASVSRLDRLEQTVAQLQEDIQSIKPDKQ